MELKSLMGITPEMVSKCFNRTFMELKFVERLEQGGGAKRF